MLSAVLLAAVSPAAAQEEQPTDPNEIEARNRFQLATTLYAQGRFEEAAAEYLRSYEVSHRPGLLFNVYLCYRDLGQDEQAAAYLRRYLAEESNVENRPLLESRLRALEEQLAAVQMEEEAEQRAADTVRVEAVPEERGSLVAPIVVMAAGGAYLAVAGALALSARAIHEDLDDRCPLGICTEAAQSDLDRMRRRTIATDVFWGLGAALVVTGLVLFIIVPGGGGGGPDEPSTALRLGCTGEGCAAAVEGRF